MSELERARSTNTHPAHAPAGGGSQAAPGKRTLTEGTSGGERLDPQTRGQMESSFGTDFGHVAVHADSPQASGGTHAFTEGSAVHFAPGKYEPGTSDGNRLIAHELAHVVQQSGGASTVQRFNPTEPGLGHEADADRAADAAVSGQKAEVRMSTRSGVRQNYEAWEHRALGDSGGGAARTITVDCGITLTYGQVVALSGDFYRSPEALMHAPRAELEAILRTMDRERTQAGVTATNNFGTHAPTQDQINQNNADYELATSGPGSRASHHDDDANPFLDDPDHAGGPDAAHPHGRVTQGNHVEDNGPSAGAPASAEDTFLGLADNNASHFSPENINLNFKPKHQLAIDLAKEAWRTRNPGATPGGAARPAAPGGGAPAPAATATPAPAATATPATPAHAPATPVPTGAATPTAATVSTASTDAGQRKEAMAYLSDGFASHFLTDAFASGHLVSGSIGRTIGASYYSRHSGTVAIALVSCLQREYPAAAAAMGAGGQIAVIGAMSALIATKAGSLTLKLVHDYFNQNGVFVKNPLNTEWQTVGDANLGNVKLAGSPVTQQQASAAAQASREGVEKAVHDGELSDDLRDKPLQYVPSEARFGSGGYQPIAAFCADTSIFDAVLSATMLSPDPAVNKLWQLIKGNVAPMISLKLQQGGRWVGNLATGAYQGAKGAAVTAGNAVVSGAKTVGNAVVTGARTAGNAIESGARTAGNAIASGARTAGNAVAHGAQVVGDGVVAGAQAVGNTAVEGARTVDRGARAAAHWVSSLFD